MNHCYHGALFASLILWTAGCHRDPVKSSADSDSRPPGKVVVLKVERMPHPATEEVVGTVQSRLRALVEAKVSGRIVRLPVTLGQLVKAGQPVAELDAQEVQARLDRASATREQAARDIERAQRLLNDKVVSQAEFDLLQARLRVAVAEVTEAETMLSYTRITAPFNGVITRRHAEIGDLASPGKPIVEIEDLDQLRIEASVPESALHRLSIGFTLPVRITGVPLTLTGTVVEMAPTADASSRTFLIKADLPSTTGLRPGQFGRVDVPMGETTTLRIPATAVFRRGQLEFVAVAANERSNLRLVKAGRQVGAEIEIVSGLEPGETIITAGGADLRDGQRLEILRQP